ncbi:hypothetical protein AURDEDRAFT_187772 [Auricularia subglabra TFB-10046 SS5]|nr:hypothetical protein AURDEDRAFT_187772 [Auricularia subglabra TFB-10046 SS5]
MSTDLLSRKRDEKAFKKYARKKYNDDPLPDHEAFECWDVDVSELIVHGFNEDADAALRTANGSDDAAAELEVPWCAMDRIVHIMRRIEEKIRIPKAYWFLAIPNGWALKSDGLACNYLAFQSPTPELVLVPRTALEAFKKSLPPKTNDPIHMSTSLFSLIQPLGSADAQAWATYLDQRKDDTAGFSELMAGLDDEGEGEIYRAMLEQIRGGIGTILCGTGLSDDQVSSAEKAIVPLDLDVQDDGDGEASGLRSADINTRIYSLHQPGAVDVQISYWNKARYYSVEWSIVVSYCMHETLPDKDAEMLTLLSCDLENTDTSGRIQCWNPREAKTFGMDGSDVQAVRRLLFGDTDVSLVDSVRLMLASIGIYVERQEDKDGEDRDKFSWFQTTTKFSLFDARWLGVQIRRACDVTIPSDADYVDRAAEPRYEQEDIGSGSDDDDYERGYDDDDWY